MWLYLDRGSDVCPVMDLNIQDIFVTYISDANLEEIGLDFKTYRNLSAIAAGAELDSCVQPEWPEHN